MKTLKNLFYMLLVLAVGGFATSCSEDDVDKGRAEGINGNGVYFPADSPAVVYIVEGQTKVEVPLVRMNDTENFSISILGSVGKDTPEIFTFQEYANFAAGSKETTVAVAFSASDIEVGKSYEVVLLLGDDDNISLYGMKEYTFSMMIDPYVDMEGEGTFNDWFLFAETYKVKIRQHSKNPNAYRVMEPWTEGLIAEGLTDAGLGVANPAPYFDFEVDPETGLVTYDYVVYPINYAAVGACDDLIMMHPSALRYQDGSTPDVTYNCQLMEGVFQIAPFIFDSDYHGWEFFQEPNIYICLPGYVNIQPMMVAAYKGIFTDPTGDSNALFEVMTNEDVSTYMWTIVEGELAEDEEAVAAAVKAMLDGSDPNAMEEIGVSALDGEELSYPMDTPGFYTAVFIPMCANSGETIYGEPIALNFEFSNGSGVAPADFTAQIEVSGISYFSATVSVTPVADNLRYYFDVMPKSVYEENIDAIDEYCIAMWEDAAERNQMELDEFVAAAGLIVRGPKSASWTGALKPGTEYVAFAYCLDTNTYEARSAISTTEFATPEAPTEEEAYLAWVGDWTVTSSEGESFDISIETAEPESRTYYLWNWSTMKYIKNYMEDGLDVPMVAQLTSQFGLGLRSETIGKFDEAGSTILATCYIDNEGYLFPGFIDGEALLQAEMSVDGNTATVSRNTVYDEEGYMYNICGLESYIIDYTQSKIYILEDGQKDLTAPFKWEKKPAASTSSVKKASRNMPLVRLNQSYKELKKSPKVVRRNLIASTNHVMVR